MAEDIVDRAHKLVQLRQPSGDPFTNKMILDLCDEVERLREIKEQWDEAVATGLIITDSESKP